VSVSTWRKGVYLLPIYPAFVLLAGYGATCLLSKEKKELLSKGLLVFLFGLSLSSVLFIYREPKSFEAFYLRNTEQLRIQKTIESIRHENPETSTLLTYGSFSHTQLIRYLYRKTIPVEIVVKKEVFEESLKESHYLFCLSKEYYERLEPELKNRFHIISQFHEFNLMKKR